MTYDAVHSAPAAYESLFRKSKLHSSSAAVVLLVLMFFLVFSWQHTVIHFPQRIEVLRRFWYLCMVHVCMHVCMCSCVCVCVCVCVYINICMIERECVYVYVCVTGAMCVCQCLCVCVYVYVSV